MADERVGTVVAKSVMNDGRDDFVVELDEAIAPEPPFWDEPIGQMELWADELRAL